MASKVSPSFFKAESILFVGYSKRHAAYCKSIREAFRKRGTAESRVRDRGGNGGRAVDGLFDGIGPRFERPASSRRHSG